MPLSSRSRLVVTVLALWLAPASGCSDLAAPESNQQSRSGQSVATPANAGLGFLAREIPVGTSVLLWGPLVSLDTHFMIPGAITWSSNYPEVAGIGWSDANGAEVRGLNPGTAQITAAAPGGVAHVAVTVLAETANPSPIVVDDFYVIEFGGDAGGWGYAPQFVLRDTTGRGGSAVIGVWFELPGPNGRTPRCAMLRPVGAQPMELFHEAYGDFELWLSGASGDRATAGRNVVAHLTLRVPGPYAKELVLSGRMVPGDLPTTYSGQGPDVLSCG